jgi:hypothetical protein
MDSAPRHFEEAPTEKREMEIKPRLVEVKEKEGKMVKSSTRFEYDNAGRVSLKEKTYPRIEGKVSQIFGYDDKDRLISVNTYIEHKADWRYAEPVRHEGVLEKTYDGDSDRVVMEQYGKDGSTMGMTEYEYDKAGRKILEKRISFGWNGASETILSYEYDEQGRLIEMAERRPDFVNPLKYNYQYDEQGRVIREDRGFVGREEPFGSLVTSYNDGGLTTKLENIYYGKKIWDSESTKDKNGNLTRYQFHDFDKNRTEEVVYENTYE